MKKIYHYNHFPPGKWGKALLLMKLKLVLLLCCAGNLSANTLFSQQTTFDVDYRNRTVVSVLADLTRLTGYQFVREAGVIGADERVDLSLSGASLEQILDRVLVAKGYEYALEGKVVMINRSRSAQAPQPKAAKVVGTVRDAGGAPMAGVTVMIKDTSRGIVTGADGRYEITASPDEVLVFSFLGKQKVELRYAGQPTVDVKMEDDIAEIDQVVVTGIFERPDKSFTGSASTFTKQELFEAGNQNLLRSLGNLDPSFIIMDNLEFGSDPNTMPEVMLRGQSTFPDFKGEYSGNPNQPLFILDGFETSIQKVYDLDMERVESITILKDASAKAIYGSRAGNGVVVIQTVKPKTGELTVYYSGTLNIDAPDLSSYNLMNAPEKLKFEVEHGMYQTVPDSPDTQLALDRLYQTRYEDVLRGVDTYWLSKPLRVGVGHKHSVSFSGGDSNMRYSAGFNYNGVKGVMKGSDRTTINANTTLSYNYKNLLFRNTIEFSRNNSSNSPYGSFSEYAALNPYFAPYDENGNPVEVLGEYQGKTYYNPLYNASLNTKNTTAYTEIRDNFQMDWQIIPSLKMVARFHYTQQVGESDVFYPASHTRFATYDESGYSADKGQYTRGENKSQTISGNVGFTFNKTFGKHLVFGNATAELNANKSLNHTFTAQGFGNDNMDDISFATKYPDNGRPYGSSSEVREVGVVAALNYAYDDRYLLDLSLRSSASSVFGANARWGTFWSAGLGWNVHKEAFAEDWDWMDRLKIRGSMGYTGTQNFNPYQAKAGYRYTDVVYDDRYGAQLMGLPNDNLKWQRVVDYTAGVDATLWGRVNLVFDYYFTVTDNLLIDNTAAPSLGFSSYKENLGKVHNRGIDMTLSVTPWRNSAKRGWLTVTLTGMHNKNTVKQISDALSSRNEQLSSQSTNRPVTLYYEGQSMEAVWGVRSVGIDPVTGDELFYAKDGQHTFNWSEYNQVVIGDKTPKLRGIVGINAGYKGFTFSLTCSYKFGGDMYNTTLFEKIENVDCKDNIDRRVSQTWLNPGDVARFKKRAITSYTTTTDPTKRTSRFVMKDNELYISTLNVGYDFGEIKGIKKLGLRNLKLSFYMNELARFSSVGIERGTSYPFSRNFSLVLQATF